MTNKIEKLLYIEPIIGYRSFTIGYEISSPYTTRDINFYLYGNGIGRKYKWEWGKNIASCLNGAGVHPILEGVPHIKCACGFYAYKSKLPLINEAVKMDTCLRITGNSPSDNQTDIMGFYSILGEVALYGKVIEHDYGYRAQYANIERLFWALYPDFDLLYLNSMLHNDDRDSYFKINFEPRFVSTEELTNPENCTDPENCTEKVEMDTHVRASHVKEKLIIEYGVPILPYQEFLLEGENDKYRKTEKNNNSGTD